MKIYAGRTFFRSTSQQSKNHLHVVLTEPEGDPPQVVIVNLTSAQTWSDQTVVLDEGEHPFVKHRTVVNFSDAQLDNSSTVKGLVETGIGEFREDLSEALLSKIQQGLLDSPRTPRWLKGHCKDRF